MTRKEGGVSHAQQQRGDSNKNEGVMSMSRKEGGDSLNLEGTVIPLALWEGFP